jgi:hypothetical protein
MRVLSLWLRIWLGVIIGASACVIYFWVGMYLIHSSMEAEEALLLESKSDPQLTVGCPEIECLCSCDGDKAELDVRHQKMEKLDVDR